MKEYNFISWDKLVEGVVKREGGYVDNPADPGGETNYGISARAYPNVDIKGLSFVEAQMIMDNDYGNSSGAWYAWLKNEYVLADMLLDTAVNMGVRRTMIFLQEGIQDVSVDGRWGPKTKARMYEVMASELHTQKLVLYLAVNRLRHYTNLTGFNTFGRGWTRRVLEVLEAH